MQQDGKWIALAIFIIASLTDLLDGKIARKYNLVTNFGKFMDPLADKLLVGAAMICLVEMGRLPAWIVIVIISREFIISGFRLIASAKWSCNPGHAERRIRSCCLCSALCHLLCRLYLTTAESCTAGLLVSIMLKM